MAEGKPRNQTQVPQSDPVSRSLLRVQRLRRALELLHGRMAFWVAVTVALMLGGALASMLGARTLAHTSANQERLGFHLASAEIASTLRLALEHEEDLVVSASAFIGSNPDASAAEFDKWAESVHAMQRYRELEDLGLVVLVPASKLPAFEARIAAHPVLAMGLHSSTPKEPFQLLPPGKRPYYCLAVAGLSRGAANYIPPGADYCALAPTLFSSRASGLPGYAPFKAGGATTLGVQIPVYRGGTVPMTVPAREREFVGWLGELLQPTVVLGRALEGHSGLEVRLHYDSRYAHVVFASGNAPANGQSTTIALEGGREDGLQNSSEGWSMQSFAPGVEGLFGDGDALALLIAGILLSGLLGLLVLVLATGRRRALSLVREKTRELSHQALHDTLTGLPNRALVLDRAEQMLSRAARRPGTLAGALFIDVDGFKHVNDNLGHAAGDRLLKIVGERLQGAMREQDTVGRLGGDEFVVLVECTAGTAPLDVLADRLTEALREPIELDDTRRVYSVTVSIGVALGHYATPDALLRDADLALYAAKASGKDRYALFDASMHMGVEGRLELEADLRSAVSDGQLFLVYQPIFALPGLDVVGVEALVRWRHPLRGVLAPDSFIPMAEESGLIVELGRWVLDEACRQAAVWSAEGLEIAVTVNVSAHQLGRPGFTEDVQQALSRSGIEPTSLILEITETALMRDARVAGEGLRELKALGVRVAIDDFGTGYASLSQLQRMPVDILKIDRSFVSALNDGGQSRELLEAIIDVGQALSLTVVAEGIEEEAQKTALEELRCEIGQGFLLARPGPAREVGELLGRGARARDSGSHAR